LYPTTGEVALCLLVSSESSSAERLMLSDISEFDQEEELIDKVFLKS
jgi:hypothetical protein